MSSRGLAIILASFLTITAACGSEAISQALPSTPADSVVVPTTVVTAQVSVSPTPRPTASLASTKVVPATAVPTLGPSTPNPPPTTPAPATTHVPADALEVNYLDADLTLPSVTSVFEQLLARIPDTEATRDEVSFSDMAALRALVGIEPPGQDDDAESAHSYVIDLIDAVTDIFPAGFHLWPLELRDYWSSIDTFSPMGFDWRNTDQTINAGIPPNTFDVAFGRYDPETTASALADCKCDQPEIREHNGISYYSWGESLIGDLKDRFKPPFYDHIGRGPRLLIEDGVASYSVRDGNIPASIDAATDNIPSLADNEDYAHSTRWLASLGILSDARIESSGYSIEDVEQNVRNSFSGSRGGGSSTAESVTRAANKGPLMLPFNLIIRGNGFDGETGFTGLVIAHDDSTSAEENVERLITRVREGAFDGRFVASEYTDTPWSELIRRIDVQSYGRFVVARLYPVDPERALVLGRYSHRILTFHE